MTPVRRPTIVIPFCVSFTMGYPFIMISNTTSKRCLGRLSSTSKDPTLHVHPSHVVPFSRLALPVSSDPNIIRAIWDPHYQSKFSNSRHRYTIRIMYPLFMLCSNRIISGCQLYARFRGGKVSYKCAGARKHHERFQWVYSRSFGEKTGRNQPQMPQGEQLRKQSTSRKTIHQSSECWQHWHSMLRVDLAHS